jgi:hypothetical protein
MAGATAEVNADSLTGATMKGKHATLSQIKQTLALRAAGMTKAVIAESTGLSISTISRISKRFNAPKGTAIKRLIEEAQSDMLGKLTDDSALRLEVAKLMYEDMALNRLLRDKIAESLDTLQTDDPSSAAVNLRALNSAASAIITAQKAARTAVGMNNEDVADKELPVLHIEELTAGQIEQMRREQAGYYEGVD